MFYAPLSPPAPSSAPAVAVTPPPPPPPPPHRAVATEVDLESTRATTDTDTIVRSVTRTCEQTLAAAERCRALYDDREDDGSADADADVFPPNRPIGSEEGGLDENGWPVLAALAELELVEWPIAVGT